MESTSSEGQTGGAGGSSTYEAFLRAEANWARLREMQPFSYDEKWLKGKQGDVPPPPQFVTTDGASGNPKCWEKLRQVAAENKKLDYDVVICGGTLGIFFALALQLQGKGNLRVAVLEAGKLRGREQEWNISRKELDELVEMGVLTEADIEAIITTEFPACRSGFKNKEGKLNVMSCLAFRS